MSYRHVPWLRRRFAALAATAGILSTAAVLVIPAAAQAFAPGFPDIYCYSHPGWGNRTRLLLGESNIVSGDPRLAYSIIAQAWDDKKGAYVPTSQTSKYALPPSDRSASAICLWANPSYPIGVRA